MVHKAVSLQISDLVLGMAHRGRLNVLANIFSKPLENVFAEFEDNIEFHFVGEGDVKYHQGFSTDLPLDEGALHMTLASNPSHLEAVDAIVEGKVRARQDELGAQHVLAPYQRAERLIWVQEEPRNMGAWQFLAPQLARISGLTPAYVGCQEMAAPAGGSHRWFKNEQQQIVSSAFAKP